MGYLTNLQWQQEPVKHTGAEEKILLALSDEKYKWRTRDRLLAVTGLDSDVLAAELAGLLRKYLVRPGFSKQKNIIYGLRERVG